MSDTIEASTGQGTDWDSLKEALTESLKILKGDSLSVTVKRSNGQEETVSC